MPLETPTLSKIRKRYFFAVCSLSPSSRANSRLLSPSATTATTCSSRGASRLKLLAVTTRRDGTFLSVRKKRTALPSKSFTMYLRDWRSFVGN